MYYLLMRLVTSSLKRAQLAYIEHKKKVGMWFSQKQLEFAIDGGKLCLSVVPND